MLLCMSHLAHPIVTQHLLLTGSLKLKTLVDSRGISWPWALMSFYLVNAENCFLCQRWNE